MWTVLLAAQLTLAAPPEVLQIPRPEAGEWFGIYLLGHKAGYSFSRLRRAETHGKPVVIVEEDATLRASLGGNTVVRRVREVKSYQARPHGALLAIEAQHDGDGGEIHLSIRFDAAGSHVTRTPKGGAAEQLELPPTKDTLDGADLPRLAASRHGAVKAFIFDSNTLKDKLDEARDLGPIELRAGGVKAMAERVSLVEDDGKVAAEIAIGLTDGRVLQTKFGDALLAVPEPEAIAHKLDTVDLFALTRVAIDKPLPSGIVPATVVYQVTGLPDGLRPESNRQTYRALPGVSQGGSTGSTANGPPASSVEFTVRAEPLRTHAERPLTEPRAELTATPAIESDDPRIRKLSASIVGEERDAYRAALELSAWVFENVHSGYGVSSDRATDVLKRREGDCTEHSLLMVALARAAGIPARLVHGLVYTEGSDGARGLYWHEWVEVFAGDWVAVDPTFGQPVADATHLQLGRGDQTDAVALMGQLKIQVLSVATGSAEPVSPKAQVVQ